MTIPAVDSCSGGGRRFGLSGCFRCSDPSARNWVWVLGFRGPGLGDELVGLDGHGDTLVISIVKQLVVHQLRLHRLCIDKRLASAGLPKINPGTPRIAVYCMALR